MSGTNPTVNSNTHVTITATSPVTQSVISAVFAAVATIPASFTFTSGATEPAATVGGSVLYGAPGSSGPLAIAAGYDYVLLDQTSSITASGGDAAATVIGDGFTYTGGATLVASGQGVANITDSGAGAAIDFGQLSTVTAFGSGANQIIQLGDTGVGSINSSGSGSTITAGASSTTTIVATGTADVVNIGNGAAATISLTGRDTVNIGTGAVSPAGSSSVAVTVTGINGATGSSNTFNIAANAIGFSPANVLLQLGAGDTVNAAGGVDTIFGMMSDVVNNTAGSVLFVGQASASTIFGGTGATTAFGSSGGEVFNVGTGAQSSNNNVFAGGATASTINAGTGGGAFFGGSHGDLYNIGTGTAQTFVGLGGVDSLVGSAGSVAPTIFAVGADRMMLTNTPAVTVVGFENNGNIDASSTAGNNVFFTGFGGTGNETLIGSTATIGGAHDVFEVGASSLAGSTAQTVPANITITNFHSGDAFYLIGFSAADNATMDAKTVASAAPGAPSGLTFTLSDNTTVTFVGNHPTGINPGANAIF